MICESFSECGGCQIHQDYATQLEEKLQAFKKLFGFKAMDFEVFRSLEVGFRARGEFRLHRENSKVFLSMNTYGKNNRIKISNCPILLPILQQKLSDLMDFINANPIIEQKLYGIKILGGLSKEVLITLIYHKKLDESWCLEASKLSKNLDCHIIGRSKGERKIITQSYVNERLKIFDETYHYIQEESKFSQPNPYINIKMIEFILSKLSSKMPSDLLEMYCGSGNFTIPLSKRFHKVFATEIVKSAITTLCENAKNNAITNIIPARLSGKETIEALSFKRDFFRLRGINLKAFDFSHILLDPPRSGIGDEEMLHFIQSFPNIIYISCNPATLKRDLETILKTHQIDSVAVFDQFPYTHHLECGFILSKHK